MSATQTMPHSQPREAAPVYRCGDHWHFFPHKNDRSPQNRPWYLEQAALDAGKFNDVRRPVYLKGYGEIPFFVSSMYISNFYYLRDRRKQQLYCFGRYGQAELRLFREEELSDTPWVRSGGMEQGENGRYTDQGTAPPAYEHLPSSSRQAGYDDDAPPPRYY